MTTLSPSSPATGIHPDRPPLGRLIAVEVRKLTDTRAGVWMMALIVLACLVIVTVQLFVADADRQTFSRFFFPTLLPVGILLPVLGVLSVTSEWSQRTVMTTFALVPRRGRVIVAKVVAGLITAVLSVGASLVFGVLGNLVGTALGGAGDWDLTLTGVGQALIFQAVNLLLGTAFGLLFLNSPLAIVLYFALPLLWSLLGELVSGLDKVAGWLDLSRTMAPLVANEGLTGDLWSRLAASVAVWVVLPLVLGVVRVLRNEAK